MKLNEKCVKESGQDFNRSELFESNILRKWSLVEKIIRNREAEEEIRFLSIILILIILTNTESRNRNSETIGRCSREK